MSTSDQYPFSRRKFVGAGGLGLAAAAAAPAFAQDSTQSPASGGRQEEALPNPTDKYPKPPFPRQSQPWPGLASQMDPRPDHGETSYRGHGRLLGRKALVTGGDSGMGRAAAIAFAREGADVAINHLPEEEPDAREVIALIKEAGRKARIHDQNVEAAKTGARLDPRRLDGGLRRDHEDQHLCAVLGIIKAALPHLGPGSTIIGTASEQAYDPSPDLYDYAQTKAATMNYVKSLAKQLGPKGIRVNAVAPGPIWTPLQVSGGATQEKLVHFGGTTSLGRPGQPAELGSIYVQLAAEDASFATGHVYGSAGGTGQP